MSNLQIYYHFKLDFQKVDQHTGGKWLIHGTNNMAFTSGPVLINGINESISGDKEGYQQVTPYTKKTAYIFHSRHSTDPKTCIPNEWKQPNTQSIYWTILNRVNNQSHKESFPNFIGCAVEGWKWISNFIPHFMMDVITSPYWE